MKSTKYSTKFRKIKSLKNIAALIFAGAVASSVSSCSSRNIYETPAVYSFKGKGMMPPPGMVYVPSGTIMYKSSSDDDAVVKRVSLSPFFIDATEVTNRQYREFIDWVADSIVITDYLKDESYFLPPDKNHPEIIAKQINWSKLEKNDTPLWLSADPNISSKVLGSLVLEQNGKKVLNTELLKYSLTYQKTGGKNQNEFVTEAVKIYPDNNVWSADFPNSQMGFMSANYNTHKTYDNYPVVGVTWKQARAFADWRGKSAAAMLNKNAYLKAYQLTYNLPTEAQWQYAAAGVRNPEDAPVSNANNLVTAKGKNGEKLLVNFKQGEGSYTMDGSTFTLPVKSYSANGFGLYNMSGNVAEWTLDAFSPSAVEFVHDLNPVLLYDASDSDAEVMKRKVIRGGSWKDNAEVLNTDTRNYEVQDQAHSYIGFRCVMPAPELLSDQVRTRKNQPVQKRASNVGRASRPSENVVTKAE
ncbi:SUMF1/EgtB/PvdO family nonheme iron enzyme [Desertivirga xinjiangensis]|uniref:type IX secretion system lipoprotein PorK/GldK n=1 Tax=Desertivirga xinjiangensis TaxID=539206 RepID=UPI00210C185A|nr:SUMF1/EgtB/PvdO family nonheme iron enzyme [Pedobacter xinjiangensis]